MICGGLGYHDILPSGLPWRDEPFKPRSVNERYLHTYSPDGSAAAAAAAACRLLQKSIRNFNGPVWPWTLAVLSAIYTREGEFFPKFEVSMKFRSEIMGHNGTDTRTDEAIP